MKNNKWTLRKNTNVANETIGRMYYVCISEPERYYLRLLLLHVPGAKGFEHLRTVKGFEYFALELAS